MGGLRLHLGVSRAHCGTRGGISLVIGDLQPGQRSGEMKAPVDRNEGAGDEATLLRAKEADRLRNLLRRCPPLHRRAGEHTLIEHFGARLPAEKQRGRASAVELSSRMRRGGWQEVLGAGCSFSVGRVSLAYAVLLALFAWCAERALTWNAHLLVSTAHRKSGLVPLLGVSVSGPARSKGALAKVRLQRHVWLPLGYILGLTQSVQGQPHA